MMNNMKSVVVAGCLGAVSALCLHAEKPDKFIQYVEATGQQAVDTGIVGRYAMRAEMKVEWMEVGGDTALLDCRGTKNGDDRVMFCHNNTTGILSWGYGAFAWVKNNIYYCQWETERIYDVKTDFSVVNGTNVQCRMWVDGLPLVDETRNALIDTHTNLYIFANNRAGAIENKSKARLYALTIYQDGDMVRNFRPCMKSGRVGLYDAVSDSIFYSFTGTELVYNQDEDVPDEFIDYVDSNGNTYVDTGVVGRSGTKAEADFEWLTLASTGDYGLLDARKTYNGTDRILMIHCYALGMGVGYGEYNSNYGHKYSANKRYNVVSDMRAGSQTLVVNGETVYSGSSAATYDTERNLYLFANNRAGTAENMSYVRLYRLKIWQDGNLVRDLQPCRKHNVPALYDHVEQRILYPALTVPANLNRRLTSANDFTAPGKPDYFTEYLESNGNMYMDTGVRARAGTRAAGDFAWTKVRSSDEEGYVYLGNPVSHNERTFLGAAGTELRYYMMHEAGGNVWAGYGTQRIYPTIETMNGDGTTTTNRIGYEANRKYSFETYYAAGTQTLDIDGVRVLDETCAENVDSGCSLYLFAANVNGSVSYRSAARCYALKIWQDGNLVRDFRPCVKNGRGMLWDEVSQTLYRTVPEIIASPATSGAFAGYGDAKPIAYLEYVDTDGTQYVDTDVIGTSGMEAEFEMAWRIAGESDQSFLGARASTSTDSRLFFWQRAGERLYYGYGGTYYFNKNNPANHASDWGDRCPVQVGHKYSVHAVLASGRQNIVADGTTMLDRTAGNTINTGRNLHLFAVNVEGTPSYFGKVRFYRLKLWKNGTLVRYFRPVLLDNGLAALWDSVDGRLFPPFNTQGSLMEFTGIGPVTGRFNAQTMIIFR